MKKYIYLGMLATGMLVACTSTFFTKKNTESTGSEVSTTYPRKTTKQPNIVLVMVDDMGYSDIGCYGGEDATPTIDKLGTEGLRFTQFYNYGRCCPTRASLLTGQFPHMAGIGAMSEDPNVQREEAAEEGYIRSLSKQCITLAEGLKPGGYHTFMSGK